MTDSVTLFNPVMTKPDVYFSKIMHDGEELTQQLNNVSVTLNKESGKLKIKISEKDIKTINDISDIIITKTSENSEKWFSKHRTEDECNKLYKNALIDDTLHCFYDENTIFYTKDKMQLSEEDLPCEMYGIALVNCIGVVYTKTGFFTRWELTQFKIKDSGNKYLIKDISEDEIPISKTELFKNMENLTLF